ncbi:MAG: cupin domain-containing protein [Pirellulales bacterium]|nr:cupin domain-containing protein [Pirellulales bacterium]
MPGDVLHIDKGAGALYRVLGGDVIYCKLVGSDTGGAFSVFETIVPPQGGPPPHVHHREDETFYVVEGQFEFSVSGRTISAGPGAVVYAPRDLPHRFQNDSATPGKMLVIACPAGIEHFFAELSQFPATGPPEVEKLQALALRYGLELFL